MKSFRTVRSLNARITNIIVFSMNAELIPTSPRTLADGIWCGAKFVHCLNELVYITSWLLEYSEGTF